MFLQVSNSSAILIFNARTTGFSFLSMPAYQLFWSAVVSQAFVNTMLLCSHGFIVEQLDIADIIKIWIYDFSWLIIIDLVKMGILRATEGPSSSVADVQGRARSSKSIAQSGASGAGRRSGVKVSKEMRVSMQGTPLPR